MLSLQQVWHFFLARDGLLGGVCRAMLGWLHNVKGLPLAELSMKSAIPSKKREGVKVAYEYMQWLVTERNISSSTEGVVIRSLMQVTIACHHFNVNHTAWLYTWGLLG